LSGAGCLQTTRGGSWVFHRRSVLGAVQAFAGFAGARALREQPVDSSILEQAASPFRSLDAIHLAQAVTEQLTQGLPR
jgi:hypothetical protein